MARRKISIQRSLGAKGTQVNQLESEGIIDQLTVSMSTTNMGFRPTDQRVYEIDLNRINPDPAQPRHLLPHDLRTAVQNGTLLPYEAMQELVLRAEQGNTVALLILGGKEKGPVEEEDILVEDTGLLALAHSIREIGLRHPLNVYRIDDPAQPGQTFYRLGEGERRFWAHHLLVLQGYDEFRSVKCIVEPLPEDEEIIHQRQEAENAARVDLPAIARARSMQRIKERLNIEMGTRVSGENTIKLPSQRELQIAIGQRVKSFTGRAIGDRMVRNYLSLLTLSVEAQDLVEAAQLTEKQLRPITSLRTDEEQIAFIKRIIEEKLSSRQVKKEVTKISTPTSSLKEISQKSVEERFEKRVIDAAKAMHSLLTLPQENYEQTITSLAIKAKQPEMLQALQSLRQTLEEVLLTVEGLTSTQAVEIKLISILPPLTALQRHLPADKFELINKDGLIGSQILEQLLEWRLNDAILASRLEAFFAQIEKDVDALRAGNPLPLPQLHGEKNLKYSDLIIYRVESGASIYWAHELLVKRGESQFKVMKAEVTGITHINDN
jgi:hypothetical protein